MGTVIWMGGAPAVAQESRATPANVEVGDIFTLTCGGKSVSYTAAAATVADVTAGLTAAWNASTVPEHEEITASDQTTYVKLLADTAGVPFTVTASTTDGGGTDTQTLTITTPTASEGPNDWSTAENWDTGAVPVNGDDVILENSDVDILYGLDQSSVTLDSLAVRQSFTATVGLPRNNSSDYVEYRDTYLAIGATALNIGQGDGVGSGRIKIDTGAVQTALVVHNTGSALEDGLAAVIWKGTHASNTVRVQQGTLDVGPFGGETATIATLDVGHKSSLVADATVNCGSGVTLTTINQLGGRLAVDITAAGITTINCYAGELTIAGSGNTITTLVINPGATCYHQAGGTITTLELGGIFDNRRSLATATITNCSIYRGGVFRDPAGVITLTNGLDLVRCSPEDVTLDTVPHRTWSQSTI